MGRAGDRVLVDAVVGGEDAAGDVGAGAGRSDHHQRIDFAQTGEVGLHRADRSFVGEADEDRAIAAFADPDRAPHSQCVQHSVGLAFA